MDGGSYWSLGPGLKKKESAGRSDRHPICFYQTVSYKPAAWMKEGNLIEAEGTINTTPFFLDFLNYEPFQIKMHPARIVTRN